ncbi:unnamed protein product, partial [Staurois parvus]
MIGTSYRDPLQRSVFHCVGGQSGHQIAVLCSPRELAQPGSGEAVYKRPPAPALPPSGRLYTWAGWEVVK